MKRRLFVAVLSLVFLIPAAAWAPPPAGIGGAAVPLDAETLDTLDSTDFALSTHSHTDYEDRLADLETVNDILQNQLITAINQIAELQSALTALDPVVELANYVIVADSTINGLAGPHVIFRGVNVHVQSGAGITEVTDGLGNLIVGYNEGDIEDRYGSHNLIVGPHHEYTSYGGFVAGYYNKILAKYSSVCGGADNWAEGSWSNISGGQSNVARYQGAHVSGGKGNRANNIFSSVLGGHDNMANGYEASICGGHLNQADGGNSSICGGDQNRANGGLSSICGGERNEANGLVSSVSGGRDNLANHRWSTVSGGYGLVTTSDYDHVP